MSHECLFRARVAETMSTKWEITSKGETQRLGYLHVATGAASPKWQPQRHLPSILQMLVEDDLSDSYRWSPLNTQRCTLAALDNTIWANITSYPNHEPLHEPLTYWHFPHETPPYTPNLVTRVPDEIGAQLSSISTLCATPQNS